MCLRGESDVLSSWNVIDSNYFLKKYVLLLCIFSFLHNSNKNTNLEFLLVLPGILKDTMSVVLVTSPSEMPNVFALRNYILLHLKHLWCHVCGGSINRN